MNAPHTARRETRAPLLLLLALTATAFALRFWRLGQWSLDSDETFTLRDSVDLDLDNPRPLLYFLNHYVIQPLHPLDELGLRLLPALFGVLAVPVLYLIARRLVGTRAALFGAFLLTFSPLHVYYSQFARYWTLVFLLSAIYPYALYIGLRERNRGALALGVITAMIAVIAHPASVLLMGGIGVWFLLTYVRGESIRQLWRLPVVRWSVVAAGVLLVAIAVWFLPLLRGWISNHEGRINTEFLLHVPSRPGIKQLAILLSYVESLTPPLVVAALLGFGLLWQGRDRSLALFLGCVLVCPVAFLLLLSFRAPISTFYLVPPIPVVFFAAGVFLDRLTAIEWELRPRWLLPAAVTALIVAAGAPTLSSQYRDGRRYDFRTVTEWLDEQLVPGDIVVADQPKVVEHYLPELEADYLRGDPAPLAASLDSLRRASPGSALWIVSPAPAHAFRTNPKIASLRNWIYEHCQLRNTVGVGRTDFRQYYLQVYRCATASSSAPAVAAHVE